MPLNGIENAVGRISGAERGEIAETADSTVVVLVPESGDSIQAMKAGLMEVADLFVINKADRPGADRLAQDGAHVVLESIADLEAAL